MQQVIISGTSQNKQLCAVYISMKNNTFTFTKNFLKSVIY